VLAIRPQLRPMVIPKTRFSVGVCHRRAGKTVGAVQRSLLKALTCELPEARTAYIAPTYGQAKRAAWDYIKSISRPVAAEPPHETELRVTLLNGSRVQLFGADNADSLRGMYFDDVVLDEYADMNPTVWPLVIRPALADRRGSALFIGTPKGRNSFWDIWEKAGSSVDWSRTMLRASETGLIAADELAAARLELTDDQYEQEFECSFDAAIIGSYYGADIQQLDKDKRITAVPHERAVSVDTAWDLGIDDATAVWFFQAIGREIRVIDYYEASNLSLTDTARALLSKPYVYGTHYLPHDVAIRELTSGKARKDTLEGVGIRPIHVGVKADPTDRINAARMMLPRCVFDAVKCKTGLEALRHYRKQWDDKRKAFQQHPYHDWSSHGADAFGEFAVNYRQKIERSNIRRRPNLGTRA